MTVLFVMTVILLTGIFTAAQEDNVRNFQVVSQSSTHITFSWDIVDGNYSSSYINNFHLYYQTRTSSTRSIYISYSSATRIGVSFQYTTTLESFNNFEEYTMWIRVYRSSLEPSYTYSERKYVNIGKYDIVNIAEIVLEFRVNLWPSQTCSDFVNAGSTQLQVGREVNWILLTGCQCGLPYDFTVEVGYFACASDYVVYRTKIGTSYNPSLDLISLKANLINFLTGQNRNGVITVNGGEYIVEPGPCGLTVPSLNSTHCFDGTTDSQASISISSASQDNTAIIAVVASMCGAVLILMLSGFIIFLVMTVQKKNRRPTGATKMKATHEEEMAAEGHISSMPQEHGQEYAYANTGVATQPNPSYDPVDYN